MNDEDLIRKSLEIAQARVQALTDENNTLKEALRFYANPDNWDFRLSGLPYYADGNPSDNYQVREAAVNDDLGDIAREALSSWNWEEK